MDAITMSTKYSFLRTHNIFKVNILKIYSLRIIMIQAV